MQHFPSDQMVLIPIRDMPPVPLGLIWCTSTGTRASTPSRRSPGALHTRGAGVRRGCPSYSITVTDKENSVTLRLTLHDGDETVVAQITGSPAPENGLQVFGDLVLLALEQHAGNAAQAAGELIGALRERDWEGDDVLADQLAALLATEAIPGLKPLPVSLDELAGVLEGDPLHGGGRIELASGQVWPEPAFEYRDALSEEEEDELEDPDKWLWVHCEGSRDGYRDMERFIETVTDPERADRLEIAITGRGAFRRFKDVLARWPGELERWYAFSADRQRGRARAWLADAGYYVRKSAI